MEIRYVICLPQGGIHDMWSRIQSVLYYCQQSNRIMVLDTYKNWFRDDWRNYFTIDSPYLYKGNQSESEALITTLLKKRSHEIFPPQLSGKTYHELPHAKWIAPGHMEMDGIKVSSSLKRMYDESVVVYADCGSSHHILPLFSIIRFHDSILQELQRRRALLPEQFVSVHIRNTDYKSNVDQFIREHWILFKKYPLFVASDHAESIEKFKQHFETYSFSHIPSLPPGINIHESVESQSLRLSKEDIARCNTDAMLDFLLLPMGSKILCSSQQSGFSRSVMVLHQSPEILQKVYRGQ